MREHAPLEAARWRLALQFAASNLRSNPRRVLLAVLGVSIGIAAVTAMLIIGNSVTAQAERALGRLGADLILISVDPMGSQGKATLTAALESGPAQRVDPLRHATQLERAAALLQAMPEVGRVTMVTRLSSCGASVKEPLASADVFAVKPELADVLSLSVGNGRFLHRLDKAQAWVVLGASLWTELRQLQPGMRAGGMLELCGRWFQIAGALDPYFGDDLLPMFKLNRSILVSPAAAESLGGLGLASQLLVRARSEASPVDLAPPLAKRLEAMLGSSIQSSGARQLNQLRQEQSALFTRFLTVLGGVALLVGSLGIANVMLVAVAERRGEIGLRMAIGARTFDIVLQFLFESVMICLCGALLGLLVGTLGSAVALALAQINFSMNVATPVWASLLALLSGLAAGAYPAFRAARLDPVTTLQGG